MQNEHGDVMEKNEWVHEGSRWCCKVNACTRFYAPKWLFCRNLDQKHGFQMQLNGFGGPSIHPKSPRQQNHIPMNVRILNNLHATQKWNENNAFD
jgi:hypothetical protein